MRGMSDSIVSSADGSIGAARPFSPLTHNKKRSLAAPFSNNRYIARVYFLAVTLAGALGAPPPSKGLL